MRLSVIIAAYNEERTVRTIVERVRAVPLDIEIVAVNDCSRDDTGAVLEQLKAEGLVDVVEHHAVKYDVGATLRRFRETDYAAQTGPVGRMFMREVATGAHHVVPFLRYIGQRKLQEPTLALEEAERDYLA